LSPKIFTAVVAAMAAAQILTACADTVINTDDARPDPSPDPVAPSSTPRPSNANLVNAFDYYGQSGGAPGYFFTTPSGTWRCVIVPHELAGCRSAKDATSLGVKGQPDSVLDATGAAVTPNAVVVPETGDDYFTRVTAGEFTRDDGPTQTLQFGRILAAAGFRCNIQDLGVSCLSETSKQGFTFSTDDFTPSYTDLPAAP
jgi:hypothetical protein